MKKGLTIAMIFTFIFMLSGCKSIDTLDTKTGDTVISDELDKNLSEDDNLGNEEEDTSSNTDESTIIMTTEQDTYPHGVKEIALNIENKSAYEFYYGVAFTLEQNVDGEWVLVTPEEVFVIEIAYILEANGNGTIVSNLSHYGDLADGHYRIVKEMIKETSGEDESTTPSNYSVAAEFNISSEEVAETSRLAAVYVSLEKDSYSMRDAVIKYTIGNNTDEPKNIVLAPRLEKEVDNGWVAVECENGFCGTPDVLKDKIEGEIMLEWYPSISEGIYKLSFDMEENGGLTEILPAIFSIN